MIRRRREALSLNLTPLIDVVFLLLIFFMVTTTFTKETRLSLTLPEAEGKPPEAVAQPTEITIGANSSYAINGDPLAVNTAAALKRALMRIEGDVASLPIVITADAMAPHQAVITVLDVVGQVGYVNVSITTQKPQ